MEKLNACPTNQACVVNPLFKDSNGDLYEFHKEAATFTKHKHKYSNASTKPVRLYLSQWFNPVTRRTRNLGPFRLTKSAMNPPPDATTRASKPENWEFVQLFVAEVTWLPTTVEAEEGS